jgi:hypothetical protein
MTRDHHIEIKVDPAEDYRRSSATAPSRTRVEPVMNAPIPIEAHGGELRR